MAQIFLALCTLAQKVGAEEYGLLPEYIKAIREECVQNVDTGVFKGERTTVYTISNNDFFERGEGAIETHTVGNQGPKSGGYLAQLVTLGRRAIDRGPRIIDRAPWTMGLQSLGDKFIGMKFCFDPHLAL